MSSNLKHIPSPIFVLQNSKPINIVLFSRFNQNILYSGNRDGDLNIFDLNTRRSIFKQNSNCESILSIAEIDQNTLLTHSRNGQIFKWTKQDDKSWKFNCIYQKEAYTFCQFKLSVDTKTLFLPSNEPGVIKIIDITDSKELGEIKPSQDSKIKRGMVMCIKQVDEHLLCAYENGELVLFDLNNREEKACVNLFNGQPVLCFDFCSNKKLGIAGSAESDLIQFSMTNESGNFKFQITSTVKLTNPGVNSIKIRQTDSLIFSCACWDSRIRIYSFKKLRLLAVLDFHKEAINSTDFCNDNTMATGSSDGFISIWDIYK